MLDCFSVSVWIHLCSAHSHTYLWTEISDKTFVSDCCRNKLLSTLLCLWEETACILKENHEDSRWYSVLGITQRPPPPPPPNLSPIGTAKQIGSERCVDFISESRDDDVSLLQPWGSAWAFYITHDSAFHWPQMILPFCLQGTWIFNKLLHACCVKIYCSEFLIFCGICRQNFK